MTEARRFPIGLTIATVISLAILLTLGSWQVQRLTWKRDLLSRIAALQAAPAEDIGSVLTSMKNGGDVEFTRVRLVGCKGLAAAPYLELYGVREGQAGSRLISACKLEGAAYGSVLVDRGFVVDSVSARPPVDSASTMPLDIVGVVRKPDPASFVSPPNDVAGNKWYTRDVPAMAAALKVADPAPMFLMTETSTNPEWAALDPAPLPAEISNRHLEYALTWFGLAGALAAVYAAVLIRKRKK